MGLLGQGVQTPVILVDIVRFSSLGVVLFYIPVSSGNVFRALVFHGVAHSVLSVY